MPGTKPSCQHVEYGLRRLKQRPCREGKREQARYRSMRVDAQAAEFSLDLWQVCWVTRWHLCTGRQCHTVYMPYTRHQQKLLFVSFFPLSI